MATARKRPAAPPPVVLTCPGCTGTGQVTRPVLVGRKRRTVGLQEAVCLDCLGVGTILAPF